MISNSSSELKKGKRVRKKGGDDGSGGWPHISYKPDLTVTPLKSNLLFTVNINFRNPVYLGFLTDRSIDRSIECACINNLQFVLVSITGAKFLDNV